MGSSSRSSWSRCSMVAALSVVRRRGRTRPHQHRGWTGVLPSPSACAPRRPPSRRARRPSGPASPGRRPPARARARRSRARPRGGGSVGRRSSPTRGAELVRSLLTAGREGGQRPFEPVEVAPESRVDDLVHAHLCHASRIVGGHARDRRCPRRLVETGHSLRSRTQRTEWSWSLRSTSVARDRVGWTFCFRLGPLISSQMRLASATASSWESEA